MRILIAALALASCSPSPPQVELAGGEPRLAPMTYHCTRSGEVYVRIELESGLEESLTGEACDYEAWRADEAVNGPVYSRGRRLNYEEWLRRRSPEA